VAGPEGQKIFGYQKRQLLRELADGIPGARLAEKYGVTEPRISQIRTKHAAEIEAIRTEAENAAAGLWIAEKMNRVAEHEGIVDMLRGSPDPKDVSRVQTSLHSVAEEMGQLPNRVTLSGEVKTVHHVIEGVDPNDVK